MRLEFTFDSKKFFASLEGSAIECYCDGAKQFWLRLEEYDSRTLTISGFALGDSSLEQCAKVLFVVLQHLQTEPTLFAFVNLGSVGSREAARAAVEAENLIEVFIRNQSKFIVGRRFDSDDRKMSMTIEVCRLNSLHTPA